MYHTKGLVSLYYWLVWAWSYWLVCEFSQVEGWLGISQQIQMSCHWNLCSWCTYAHNVRVKWVSVSVCLRFESALIHTYLPFPALFTPRSKLHLWNSPCGLWVHIHMYVIYGTMWWMTITLWSVRTISCPQFALICTYLPFPALWHLNQNSALGIHPAGCRCTYMYVIYRTM
jgi:hypothetical protein